MPGTLLAQEEVFCDEFHLVDLRVYDNCKKVVKAASTSSTWQLTWAVGCGAVQLCKRVGTQAHGLV